MKKTELLSFINRYYLNGAVNSVKWKTSDNGCTIEFISDDQNVIGTLTSDSIELGTSELGVYATPLLTKMLSAVSDDVDIDVNKVGDKAVSLAISDGEVNMTFMLADLSIIRQVPELKNMPDWNVTIPITDDFRNKFIKAKNAIPDADNFGVHVSAGTAELVINYSTINNNRIKFNIDADNATDMGMTCFSASLLKEMMMANKDATQAKLEVSAAGLARATFTGPDYECTYFLVQLQVS